jgi:hypothetical protein
MSVSSSSQKSKLPADLDPQSRVRLPYLKMAELDAKGRKLFDTFGSKDDREMGHCRAGHTLWRTIVQLASKNAQKKTWLFSDGFLRLLHPANLVEGTADRARLFISRNGEVARQVLLTSSLRLF